MWIGSRVKGDQHRVRRVAKKDKKKDKAPTRGDAVRSAVEQAFQASAEQAETARGRASDIVEEFAQAAGRVREALEELRPPTGDDVKELKATIARLEKRVAALEEKQTKPRAAPRRAAAKKPAARKPAARKPSSGGTT
jgi:polyhydroxyalkanoate synthesis regulator phasin